jgi:hypothetical protein
VGRHIARWDHGLDQRQPGMRRHGGADGAQQAQDVGVVPVVHDPLQQV